MDQLVDIAALRPSDYEQLQLLADRLRVPLTRQWRRTLRWAGRALLATHADAVDAERIVLAAKEAGISTLVRPSHPTGQLEQFLTAHADALGTAAFIAASLGIFLKLFFFHDYRAVIHFLGLLWLHLVTRDQTVFHAVGVIAGVGASLATGYIAMISVHCALAWTRLSPPLVVTTRQEVIGDIHPLPVIRFFDWRRLRLVAGAAAIVAVLWFAATIIIHRYVRGDLPAALAAVPEANRAQLPLPTDPWKARDELQDRSMPRPDRRFLRGLADVDRLVLGAPSEPRIEWVDAGWKVSVGAQLVGVLPARPSFADGLGLLRSRVRQIANGKHTSSGEAFEGGSDDDALARLRRAQHAWPRGRPLSAAAIHDAAGALALLSFHAIDNMGVGDALPSRALAALALDEEIQGTRQPALETLMAESMRYLQSAREAAAALSAEDPIRLYVLREDDILERIAKAGPTWPRLLWLRRLGEQHRQDDAETFRRTELANLPDSVALLHQPLWQTQDVRAQSIRAALPLVKAALEREWTAEGHRDVLERLLAPFRTGPRDEPLVDAFERELNEIDTRGPLLDRDVVGAYYRGALYTGIRQAVEQLAEAYGDPEAARAFITSLGRMTEGPAQHLAIWAQMHFPYATGYEYVQGKPGAEQLAASLQLTPDAIDEALRYATDTDEAIIARARRLLIARLDTRPHHRLVLATEALRELHDVSLARRACQGVLVEADDADFGALICSRALGDKQRLLRIARTPSLSLKARAEALTFLSGLEGTAPAEVDAEFERLLPFDDGWAQISQAYVGVLEARREYGRAQQVIEKWLPPRRGFSIIELIMRAGRARMLQMQGDPQEAWRELEPLMESQHSAVLMRAAYVLSALGRHDQAVAVAQRRLARFKRDWNSLTTLLEVMWRGGKSEDAAALLAKPPFRIDVEGWREQIGPAFARAFRTGTDEQAMAAFATLRRRGIHGRELREMAVSISGDVRNSLALAMLSSLIEAGTNDAVTLVRTAAVLRILKGEVAAREWLLARLKTDDLYSTAREMYRQEQDALLWDAIPEPMSTSNQEWVWLLRAASARRAPAPARSQALADRFASPQGSESYLLGRYLAGLADESSIKSSTHRTQAAWALGVRAEAEGRIDDAIAWYGVATAAGDWKEPERGFAERRLLAWAAGRVKSLTSKD